MKGRRKEMSKRQLHATLSDGFGVENVHSEYGMTELLSQAYSDGGGIYKPIATMKVIMTEINDPLALAPYGKAGVINIIDLANIDSCCFISTEDVGISHQDGTFEIVGRLDQSDIRGCNLMVADLQYRLVDFEQCSCGFCWSKFIHSILPRLSSTFFSKTIVFQ